MTGLSCEVCCKEPQSAAVAVSERMYGIKLSVKVGEPFGELLGVQSFEVVFFLQLRDEFGK
jgi:hypothetical protein